jgi:putative copper export protein/mono/diheme cytochrome c family protein
VQPSFDLQGGLALALVRGLSVAALLSVFGTLLFRIVVAPRAFARVEVACEAAIKRRLLATAQISIVAGLLATVAWTAMQAGYMADADSAAEALAAVPRVVSTTEFGHLVALQVVVLLGVAGAIGLCDREVRLRVALGLATIAVVLQAGHSHAYSMDRGASLLTGCDVLHLLGAGGWLGGLVPLMLLIRVAPPRAGAVGAWRFSPLGKWCIGALLVSASYQGWVLVASIPGLIGTWYGWMVLTKLALFGVLVGFACANRYRFTPALMQGDPIAAKRVIVRSIVLQSLFALAIVAAAAVLSALPPSMHEQPWWPFARLISLAAVREDADFRREVVQAALALAGALGLVAVSLLLRRFRLAALGLAVVIAWFAVPHFGLLLADATPTSFYHSPSRFTSDSIVAGEAVFAAHCVACHGADGSGDGPAAKSLPVPPADLTAAHLWFHSDGELFWWLSHGMAGPDGGLAMPGFANVLDDGQLWAAIDYIRAHNEGVAMRATGRWPQPVRAPEFVARCAGLDVALSDLRGRFVRLVIGEPPANAAAAGVVTIFIGRGKTERTDSCTASGADVAASYAIISGAKPGEIAGMQFLIDDQGWLRALQRPGAGADWQDARALDAEIRVLRTHPEAASPDAATAMPMNMKM